MSVGTKFLILLPIFLAGCATMDTGEDVQPILQSKLVGLPVTSLFALYGEPDLSQVQQGHHVYYWQRLTAYSYTPQYTAVTQGTIDNTVPFSSTTTMAGEPQAGAVPCVLVAGTVIGGNIVERIQVRGISCGAFTRPLTSQSRRK